MPVKLIAGTILSHHHILLTTVQVIHKNSDIAFLGKEDADGEITVGHRRRIHVKALLPRGIDADGIAEYTALGVRCGHGIDTWIFYRYYRVRGAEPIAAAPLIAHRHP